MSARAAPATLLFLAVAVAVVQSQGSGSGTGAVLSTGLPPTDSPSTGIPSVPLTTAIPTTTSAPPTLPTTGITSFFFCDFTKTSMTPAVLASAIQAYSQNVSANPTFLANPPMIFDTRGDVLTALRIVGDMIVASPKLPDLIFIADGAPVTIALNDVLKTNSSTRGITVISLFTSNPRVCDVVNNPSTVCMVPRDLMNVRAAIEMSVRMGWSSVAAVFSNNDYGLGVLSVLQQQLSAATTPPTVVGQGFIPTLPDAVADMAFLQQITQYQPTGIFAFVSDTELLRLRAAAAALGYYNTPAQPKVFFIGSKESISILDQMNDTQRPWAALAVPNYDNFYQVPIPAKESIDYRGMFLLSHLFDAMTLITMGQQTSAAGIRSQTCYSSTPTCLRVAQYIFTGDLAFDPATGQRVSLDYNLRMAYNRLNKNKDGLLLHWRLDTPGAQSVMDSDSFSNIVPSSPLKAVTVCMASPPTCGSVSSLNALMYMFLNQNSLLSQQGGISIIPVPINTGVTGVQGLNALIPLASTCTILTGPGDLTVNMALTPVINSFGISQIDYSAGSTSFSNKQLYPFFSRTTTADDFTIQAYAEVCDSFDWERVLVITTRDLYGQGVAAAVQNAMDMKTILIEQLFQIQDTSNASLADALGKIQTYSISRIVLVLIPVDTKDGINFFNLVQQMNMTWSHIFILGNDLCQISAANPGLRAKLPSSICAAPNYDIAAFGAFQTNYTASPLSNQTQQLLFQSGFTGVYQCNLSSLSPYSAFALDAGQLVLNVVQQAISAKMPLTNSTALLPLIRGTAVKGWSGAFQLDSVTGDRPYASFSVDIQSMTGDLLRFAVWDTKAIPNFQVDKKQVIVWLDNTTTPNVPSNSIRSAFFIAQSTVSANPGAIALSILGFGGTIAIFVFCYRHYKMQKLIELSLENNQMQIDEEAQIIKK